MKKKYAQLDFYNKQYSDFNKENARKDARYLISRLDSSIFKNKKNFLDVGTGAGILASEISKTFGVDAYGIDLSPRAIEESKECGVKTKKADFEKKWPFRNNFFDIV